MNKIVHLLLMLFFISSFIEAQESLYKNPFWFNVSVGGSPQYLNISSSYNKSLENLSYQISINGTTKGILSRKGMTTGNIGVGIADCKEWLISSVYFGPSVSCGEANSLTDQNISFWGFGFALNAQAYFMPLHKIFAGVGLGIELFYNINAVQTKDLDYGNVYSIRIGVCLTDLHMK